MSSEGQSLGTARVDLVLNTDQHDAAITASTGKVRNFSTDAQAAYTQISSKQKQVTDSLVKQADTWGLNRGQMILYKAEVAGLPTAIIDELRKKLEVSAGAAQMAAAGVASLSDGMKATAFSDSQLLKYNQALADMRTESDAARTSLAALAQQQTEDDARFKAIAAAGFASQGQGIAQSARGASASLTPEERAAQAEQIKNLAALNSARDRERQGATEAAAAEKAAAAAAEANAAALQELIGKIDPAVAALARLDQYETKLRAAKGKGLLSEDDFNAYAATIDQTRAKITGADAATGHFTLSTAGARREIGVLIGELAQGNFGNFQNSLATLASRSGLLAGVLSPIGALVGGIAAGVLALGAAAISGANDEEKLNQAIVSTSNYAGTTVGQVNALAVSIGSQTKSVGQSRVALDQLVASGKVTGDRLAEAAQGAVDFSTVTGESIDKSVQFFVKLQDDPVKAIQELDAQYHVLTLTQYENIKALEAQGDASAAAAIAQTAAAQSFAQRAAEVRQNQGLIESGWHEIETAASAAWDAMKGIGRTSTNVDDISAANKQLDAIRARMPQLKGLSDSQLLSAASSPADANHAYLAGDLGLIQQLVGQKQAAQSGALLEQWVAQNDADYAKINDDAKKASDTMSKYLVEAKAAQDKAAEVAKVKTATQLLIKGNRANTAGYLADQQTALAQIDKKYTNHDAKAADSADETAQVAAFKASLASMGDAYKNSQAELDAARKAGTVSEEDYYQQSQDLLWKNESDQVTAIQAEINRLQTRKAVGAERIKLDGQINQLEAEAAKVEADAISKSDQLADQEKASYQKRTQAIDAYRFALDKANVSLQAQMDAQAAHVGMGDQEYQQLQKVNQAYTDQANKLQELALQLQAGSRGESGGIDQRQYDSDVAALQEATDKRVSIVTDGYKRQKAAEADYENGVKRGLQNWVDQASNAADQVASLTDSGLNGAGDYLDAKLTGKKASFSDYINSIIADLVKLELKVEGSQVLSQIFPSLFGGSTVTGAGDSLNGGASYTGADSLSTGWAGMGGGWSFNAKGGVYASPSLSAYTGNVYDSPHLFKFASGAGVFGEAGPEAIMPLTRGANGKLGVAASGAGGGGTKVEVINNSGQQATTQQGTNADGTDWVRVIVGKSVDEVNKQIMRGGSTGMALSKTFGLARRGISVGGG